MSADRIQSALDHRNFALAVVQVLQMWSNDSYRPFLCGSTRSLDAEWFQWFVGEWNVARTIQDGKRDHVRRYLDLDFRRAVTEGTDGKVIDDAASHIRASGWSAKLGKKKIPALPISLVSKIGFFLRPSKFVPLDSYSLIGLNQLRSTVVGAKLIKPTYQQYLAAFNEQFEANAVKIGTSVDEPWVSALATKLGSPVAALKTTALRRKVFDNYLMHTGGYLGKTANPSAS